MLICRYANVKIEMIMTDIEKALSHCRDRDEYPDVFNENYGIGITFKDEKGIEYTTVKNIERKLFVSIQTFGSYGNWHYYGEIKVFQPSLKYLENGVEKTGSICGYFDRHKPVECLGVNIEVVRKVTQQDFDNNPIRWDGYCIGWDTPAFDTKEELKKVVDLILKERFSGNWIIKIDD